MHAAYSITTSLGVIGRTRKLFEQELLQFGAALEDAIGGKSFLVIGGGGSIGQAVVKELFQRNPRVLHVVDISENNLVELVRDMRSSFGYIRGDFDTYALDIASAECRAFLSNQPPYDYVLNLSALKHVRSEKDPYTLMRLIEVNILNTIQTVQLARDMGSQKYFCVSTDKATNPVNMMGASKRIMELFLLRESAFVPVSTARFANVAFSDGSLLHGFAMRMAKRQPLSAPRDVKRYFITQEESGFLCVMSCLLGANRDIFFPKLDPSIDLLTFADIAARFLESLGYEPDICASEDEARQKARTDPKRRWPCYFFDSDTTGEKAYEEFYTDLQDVDMNRFPAIGVIRNAPYDGTTALQDFLSELRRLRTTQAWTKTSLVQLFRRLLPEFKHYETGRNLNERM